MPADPKARNILGHIASRPEWLTALDRLPDLQATHGRIPSFFFAHGQPTLLWPKHEPNPREGMFGKIAGPGGLLCEFLEDFGKTLLDKYNPKGIVVFSAHWETGRERLVSDYGDENPLLYDYYGFPQSLYDMTYRSKGSRQLSERVVKALQQAGHPARLSPVTENRGRDGRRKNMPKYQSGLDHGVFVPFKLMFPDDKGVFDVPIVEVSIDASLDPQAEYELGRAVKDLRDEGILILAGGLTVHTFDDFSAFNADTAKTEYHDWNDHIVQAVNTEGVEENKKALFDLVKDPTFRLAHPREEHFVPLYIGAGAGDGGRTQLVCGLFGATTVAFGL